MLFRKTSLKLLPEPILSAGGSPVICSFQDYTNEINSSSPKVRLNEKILSRDTPVISLGSCFADRIAIFFAQNGFNYLRAPEVHGQIEIAANWGRLFTSKNIKQVFEYALTDSFVPKVRWWPHKNKDLFIDPYRRIITSFPKRETAEEDFSQHCLEAKSLFTNAKIIIITLGLIEFFSDIRDELAFASPIPKGVFDHKNHCFCVQDLEDVLEDLEKIHSLLSEINPEAKIIISTSPVPLHSTFREDIPAIEANALSKATLRLAAEYFSIRHSNVFYFGAYDLFKEYRFLSSPFAEDHRHPTQEMVDLVMQTFLKQFSLEIAK